MKFFLLAASDSRTSLNKKLIGRAAMVVKGMGHDVDLAQFEEFPLPLYSANIQADQGIPQIAEQFVARMHAADKIIISSPEYNGSIPGTLKNLIDWVSRIRPMPWEGQDILLLSASVSIYGGVRGLIALKQPLELCGSHVYPKTLSVSTAQEAFDEEGNFIDPKREESLRSLIETFTHTRIVRE